MDMLALRTNNYNLMCRLCLSTDDYLLSIFDEKHTFLPQRIAACVNVETHKGDNLPTTICKQCLTKVEDWFNFKKCCDDSQSKLRQWASINHIICTKTLNIVEAAGVKKEAESDSEDDIQIIETDVTVKQEPVDAEVDLISMLSEEETERLHLSPEPSELQISPYESTESLLVPTFECPATVHGINAPEIPAGSTQSKLSPLSRNCRICLKEFSSVNNRKRHEQNVHHKLETLDVDANVDNQDNEDDLLDNQENQDDPLNIESEIQNVHSLNSEEFDSDVNIEDEEDDEDVDIESFAANLQLVPSKVKPMTEKHFLEYYGTLCNMMRDLKCMLCGSRYTSYRGIVNHLYKIMKVDKFSCFVCCIVFPNRSQYGKHIGKKSCDERDLLLQEKDCPFKTYEHYQCAICWDFFSLKKQLTSHLLDSHLKAEHPPSCNRCEKKFESADEYKEHLQSACFYKVHCSICKINLNVEDFTEHCKIHDDDGVEFSIDEYINKDNDCRNKCGVKKEIDDTINKYSCSKCGDQFPTLDMWCEHQQNHSDNNIHRCTECNRVFVTELELDQHKNTHNNNIKLKLYRCSDTNSYKTVSDFSPTSSTSPNLEENGEMMDDKPEQEKEEANTTEEKTFKCGTCKKVCNTEHSLRAHKRKHINSDILSYIRKKKVKQYCFRCKVTFANRKLYFAHRDVCYGIRKKRAMRIKAEPLEDAGMNSSNSYICQVCNKSFLTDRGLTVHSKLHKKENTIEDPEQNGNNSSSIICQICNKSFLTERGLTVHSKIHTQRENESDKMECQLCHQKFINIEALLDHMKSHTTKSLSTIFKPEKYFECETCKKSFLTQKGLLMHVKVHESSLNLKIKTEPEPDSATEKSKCNFCNLEFENRVTLNRHIKIHLNGANIEYNCTFCSKVCGNSYQLISHVKAKHPVNGGETTPVKVKEEIATFACDICDKVCTNQTGLKLHLSTHTDKKFKCNKCFRRFPTSMNLDRHVKNNCYRCEFCNRGFETLAALVSHKRKHNNTNPRNFTCKKCKLVFKISKDYLKHIQTHKNLYKCSGCPRTFLYKKTLLNHSIYAHGDNNLKTKSVAQGDNSSKTKSMTPGDNSSKTKSMTPGDNNSKAKTVTPGENNSKTKSVTPGENSSKTKSVVKNPMNYKNVRVKTEVKERPTCMYRCTKCNTTFVNSTRLRAHVLSAHMPNDV